MNTYEPLPARTLVRTAHHEFPAEAPAVAAVTSLLTIAGQVQAALRRHFESWQISEHKFAALVALYTFDPVPTTATDLAFHTQMSRTVLADVLAQLDAASWITRVRDPQDRRAVFVSLTKSGRATAQRVLQEAARVFAMLGRGLDAEARAAITNACGVLRERLPEAFGPISPSPRSSSP